MRKGTRLILIFLLLVTFTTACSLREDMRPDKNYKPMIKYEDRIYQLSGEDYDPVEELIEIGEIEESFMDGSKPVGVEDKDLTSNVIDIGTILYQEINSDNIIIKGNEGMLLFKPID